LISKYRYRVNGRARNTEQKQDIHVPFKIKVPRGSEIDPQQLSPKVKNLFFYFFSAANIYDFTI